LNLIDLKYLNAKRLEALSKTGISRPMDLLEFFPRKYLDKTNIRSIGSLAGRGEKVTVAGKVMRINTKGYGNKKRLEVFIKDEHGYLKGVWFKGANYLSRVFNKGDQVAFYGTVKRYGRYISMAHPDFDKLSSKSDIQKVASIVPIYPSNKHFAKCRINSSLIQQWISTLLETEEIEEFLPLHIIDGLNLPERYRAFHMVHNPEKRRDWQQALYRFKFEEFFLFQIALAYIKQTIIERANGAVFTNYKPYTSKFFNTQLPFRLTEGQKAALSDIKRDVRSGKQMYRLIQGDVGSGKTIVATGAMLMALDNGYQAAMMAPTEILAEQHYRTLTNFLEPLGGNIRLLTGKQSRSLRMDILTALEGGQCDIVVGTHAIIQDSVNFHNLGLVVIDEQHRFGVAQRAEILQKGSNPHLLVMSATPIPRSLAMTLYGDLDISAIKELPAGRIPVITAVRKDNAREDIYNFVEEKLNAGGQAYIVYPLVEESEALDLKDATVGYDKICRRFEQNKVGLLHGKMSTEDKEATMRAFESHQLDILVSTTVIEVGVDVPNANVMIIEHAERFGLSQLHQLRGRIGRGKQQSYCILMAGEQTGKVGWKRLRTLEHSQSGFHIAEIDLKMRGPGNFLGTQQSGLPEFNTADIIEDQQILEKAKSAARQIIKEDPNLEMQKYKKLKEVFLPYFENRARFYGIS